MVATLSAAGFSSPLGDDRYGAEHEAEHGGQPELVKQRLDRRLGQESDDGGGSAQGQAGEEAV